MKINYYTKYWLPVILYMGFIFYLSSLPNPIRTLTPGGVGIYFDFDRIFYHVIEFLILSLLLYRALKINSKHPQSLAIIIAVAYAITDELHQYFIPGRVASFLDILFDSFGAIIMQSIIVVYNKIKNNK